jgi:hypothetical protein
MAMVAAQVLRADTIPENVVPVPVFPMSRLRRLVVSDRWFCITCRVLPRRLLNCAQLRATPLSPKGARGVSMCK